MNDTERPSQDEILYLTSLAEVFGGFAHEIAQPLNAIMIASQVMQLKVERSSLPESEKVFMVKRLAIVSAQVQRANDIVDSLRKFTRAEQEEPGSVDLQNLLSKIMALMDQQFVMRGIQAVGECVQPLSFVGANAGTTGRVLIQGLAFARDAITAIGSWHAAEGIAYEKRLKVLLTEAEDFHTIHMSWDIGRLADPATLKDAYSHLGLETAAAVLAVRGGALTARDDGLTILLPIRR